MCLNGKFRAVNCLWIVVVALFVLGCDDDDVKPALTIDDFVGTWQASSMLMTNNANSSETFEFVKNGGEVRFVVLPGGDVRTWITLGPFADEWDAEVWLDGDVMRSKPVETARAATTMPFEWDGEVLKLINANDSFDFTLMNNDVVSATSVGLFRRQ